MSNHTRRQDELGAMQFTSILRRIFIWPLPAPATGTPCLSDSLSVLASLSMDMRDGVPAPVPRRLCSRGRLCKPLAAVDSIVPGVVPVHTREGRYRVLRHRTYHPRRHRG